MNKTRKSSGFTLIELVIIILILGILGATAAPKFLDMGADARIANLNGLKNAIKSTVEMTYSNSVISGINQYCRHGVPGSNYAAPTNVNHVCYGKPVLDETKLTDTTSGDNIDTAYGIPMAKVAGIIYALQGDKVSRMGNLSTYQNLNNMAQYSEVDNSTNLRRYCKDAEMCYLYTKEQTLWNSGAKYSEMWIGFKDSNGLKLLNTANKGLNINESESCALRYRLNYVKNSDKVNWSVTVFSGGC